jgi:hypothetical protein
VLIVERMIVKNLPKMFISKKESKEETPALMIRSEQDLMKKSRMKMIDLLQDSVILIDIIIEIVIQDAKKVQENSLIDQMAVIFFRVN